MLLASPAIAQKQYGPGATDTEIKIGNINPYSGPASAYGMIGRTIAAYFGKVNAEGGVNGRKITFISYDDGYSPPKTVEQARKLVESDEVLLIFQSLGTAHNTAIERYMNGKGVPQLFVATGATKFGDPTNFPWTMGWQPNYQSESRIYAKYLIEQHPNGKIGVLYQNDDYGKDYLKGLKDGLAGKIPIVSEQAYETTDPTVNSQIISLKGSGADIFFNVATPKFAAQAIRKVAELDWHPLHLLNNVSNSVGSVLKPAGMENAKDVLSTAYYKDPTDPTWQNDPSVQGLVGIHGQVFSGRRSHVGFHGLRICGRPDHDPRARAMRRRSDPRQRDEAGGVSQGADQPDAAPRNHHQHQRDRLFPDRTDANDAIYRRALGAVRPSAQRPSRKLACRKGR